METRKLISPNAAEELLPKDKRPALQDYWRKPAGGPTIALASDKRDAYDGTHVDGFEDEDDDGLD